MWANVVNFEKKIVAKVSFANGYKERILNFLHENHEEVTDEIGMKDSVTIRVDAAGAMGGEIVIVGSKGVLKLAMIKIDEI
jgi:hypothetical protein